MKRVLAFILMATMLLSVFMSFNLTALADFPDKADMGGYENLCLTYTWNPSRNDNGRQTVTDLMPYVAYHDANNNMVDFFFDSYLFLPCVANGVTGARLHYDTANPTKALDWIAYVEDTFNKGTNVDALNEAFGKAKNALNAPDKKAGVFFTILYPAANAGANFGNLGGKQLNLSRLEDRKYAIKWMIDEQLRLYNERGYDNLELVGFYWLEEYLYGNKETSEDKVLFKYASDYLHSLGLKFIWIPWFKANGFDIWKELGFDAVCMQPNMYWQTQAEKDRVQICNQLCNQYGMGVEIEIDGRGISNGEFFNRYLDYLEGCMQSGAMNSIKMYYQDGKPGIYQRGYYTTEKYARAVYDLTYKYAKGTLTKDDIAAYRSDTFKLPENVEWVSIGKSYTATQAYADGSGAEYQQIDGKELTDGVIANSELGTEWHGFHKTLKDSDGRMSITIDLGEVRNDLTHFLAQFSHIEKYGIDDPADDVTIYVSEDGENFRKLAQPSLQYVDVISYIHIVTAPTTARYVKYSFINSNANFVFCGEAMVGVTKAVVDNNDNNESNDDSVTDSNTDEIQNDTSADASIGDADDTNVETSVTIVEKGNNSWLVWSVIGVVVVLTVAVVAIIKKKKK
ncbi:MAG: DUF4855 domain-containing protein [Clostridia bacterium]|nr:DUF4855 domain-containing protein [Clostridia bacterium]